MRALLLLSGGLDSAILLFLWRAEIQGCIGFDYGQPHIAELERAAKLARRYEQPFEVVKLPELPLVNDVVFAGRNAVMLATAAAAAQACDCDTVLIGANADDQERFPDCRPEFLEPFGIALRKAYGVEVRAPLLTKSKKYIVEQAHKIGLELEDTLSCYQPVGRGQPCGECLACCIRTRSGA
jgi:7-cyano-7-deazaguanine synthase